MKCSHCGAEAGEKLVCSYCGARTNPQYVPLNDATKVDAIKRIDDVPNFFLIILAFFIPLFGIIYYFSQIGKVQAKARAYGISAVVGIICSAIVLIMTVLTILT